MTDAKHKETVDNMKKIARLLAMTDTEDLLSDISQQESIGAFTMNPFDFQGEMNAAQLLKPFARFIDQARSDKQIGPFIMMSVQEETMSVETGHE